MTEEKRAKLEATGVALTDTKDWIGLTIEEAKIVEMRVNLMKALDAMGTPVSRIAATQLLCTAAGN